MAPNATNIPNDFPFFTTGIPVPLSNTTQIDNNTSILIDTIEEILGNNNNNNNTNNDHDDETSNKLLKILQTQGGFTKGLAKSLINDVKCNFPFRIWVVDNSGSMTIKDGKRIALQENRAGYKIVPCTRWKVSCLYFFQKNPFIVIIIIGVLMLYKLIIPGGCTLLYGAY